MKNLAGCPPVGATTQCCRELQAADINIAGFDPERREVQARAMGELRGWTFTRAWSHWVARTQHPSAQIPQARANRFNESWGSSVRVDGFAGGTDAIGPVGCYHIDTPEGLVAFSRLLMEQCPLETP